MKKLLHDGSREGEWIFWCPGCKLAHSYLTGPGPGPRWEFNGDHAKPTFTPSLLVRWPPLPKTCHLFVIEGRILFCADSTHALAGTAVPMEPFEL
jgi:hypothetical protein